MSDTELACDATPWGVAGFVNALTDIRRAGFTGVEAGVELVPAFEDRVHILQEMLEAESLTLVTIRTPVRQLSGGSAEEESERCLNVARFLTGMEGKLLVVTPPPYDPESLEEEWLLFTNLLSEVGKRCEESGIRMALNPQPGTIIATRAELEKLLKSFTVKALPLAVDAAFLTSAKLSPQTFFKKYRNRLGHLYLSDLHKSRARKGGSKSAKKSKTAARPQAQRTELGRGAVKLERFVDAAHAAKYSGWVTVRLPDEPVRDLPERVLNGYKVAAEILDVF
jgi:sugar phosphate isomerase/epimerase